MIVLAIFRKFKKLKNHSFSYIENKFILGVILYNQDIIYSITI